MVSGISPEGFWKVIESFLYQVGMQSKLNSWATKIKMKTYTWNSNVGLLSLNCFVPISPLQQKVGSNMLVLEIVTKNLEIFKILILHSFSL